MTPDKPPLRITYAGDDAYLYFDDRGAEELRVARTFALETSGRGVMIHVDFDHDGRMIGVEVLGARRFLTNVVIRRAESIVRSAGSASPPPLRIRFDANADAAYLYLVDPVPDGGFVAETHELETLDLVVGPIHFDFDHDGYVVGIEVLRAIRTLTSAVLERAERIRARVAARSRNSAESIEPRAVSTTSRTTNDRSSRGPARCGATLGARSGERSAEVDRSTEQGRRRTRSARVCAAYRPRT